jgi:hypothetical protein
MSLTKLVHAAPLTARRTEKTPKLMQLMFPPTVPAGKTRAY